MGGGGIFFDGGTNSSISSSLIANNSISPNPTLGGGIHAYGAAASVLVENSTFYNNGSGEDNGVSIVGQQEANIELINSIVWDESAAVLLESDFGIVSALYSNIKGGYVGTGNIDVNPEFINPSENNFKLKNWSPAIGAGLDTLI